jgi:nucleoside-diphosphate-sugar epimerase
MTVEGAQNPGGLIVVAGAGGFVGGHLVERLREEGHTRIRAVDIKPFEDWPRGNVPADRANPPNMSRFRPTAVDGLRDTVVQYRGFRQQYRPVDQST